MARCGPMPADPTSERQRAAPWMLLYSLLFGLAYLLCALVVGGLLLTFARRPGPLSFLSHLIVVAAALVPGWGFARRHQRRFAPQERRRLIALCISWVVVVEGLSLASRPDLLALPLAELTGALALGLGSMLCWCGRLSATWFAD